MSNLIYTAELPAKRAGSKANVIWGDAMKTAGVSVAVIEKVIKRVSARLPDLANVAMVELATGACLAPRHHSRGFGLSVVAARKMCGERLEDILIPFRKQLHLIRLARNGQWVGYPAMKAQDTSLALASKTLKAIIL